ncbi:MAG TPA: hypothetical protein VHB30_02910, partial [Solirubrobacteraceae bacterium]|nr:hypothetical protein [Solirubrobacteraceae bacterium]
MTELAPAKVNLCLFLGPLRDRDGRHELVSVMQPLAFGDGVAAQPADEDVVVCAEVGGPNLAERALRAFRERVAPHGPRLRLTIDKRIPVAGGMAGGSADAGAALRLAAQAAGVG